MDFLISAKGKEGGNLIAQQQKAFGKSSEISKIITTYMVYCSIITSKWYNDFIVIFQKDDINNFNDSRLYAIDHHHVLRPKILSEG